MLKVNSDPRNVSEVQPFVDRLVHKYKIAPDLQGNILIGLTEAVTNAIRHGNMEDRNKVVRVQLSKRKDTLSIRVIDEGQGFDYENLPDPTAPENLCKCGGRGVYLMRELADDLQFHNNGSTVEMCFRI